MIQIALNSVLLKFKYIIIHYEVKGWIIILVLNFLFLEYVRLLIKIYQQNGDCDGHGSDSVFNYRGVMGHKSKFKLIQVRIKQFLQQYLCWKLLWIMS